MTEALGCGLIPPDLFRPFKNHKKLLGPTQRYKYE